MFHIVPECFLFLIISFSQLFQIRRAVLILLIGLSNADVDDRLLAIVLTGVPSEKVATFLARWFLHTVQRVN